MTPRATKSEHVALIVEDDPVLAKRLAALLESLHFEAIVVGSQSEAESILASRRVCLVFLDVQIPLRPGGDGVENGGLNVLRGLRQRHATDKKPGDEPYVIIMTGTGDQVVMQNMAWRYGANDFAGKPIFAFYELPNVKVDRALAQCRERYPDCCPALVVAPRALPRLLRFVGKRKKQAFLVQIDKKDVWIPPSAMRFLWRLHLGSAGEGWVRGEDAYTEGTNFHKPWSALLTSLGDFAGIVQKDEDAGRYRLLSLDVVVDQDAMREKFSGLLDEVSITSR